MPSGVPSAVQNEEIALNPGEARIRAVGEMADRTRRFPWSSTPVGAPSKWSEALVAVVNLMLESQFPTLLFWGPELAVFYNDAYRAIMADKHPLALGRPAKDCWSESWQIIGPQLEAVMERAEKFYRENLLVPTLRNGALCDVYWTYSYSPVRDTGGVVGGVQVVCHDVTAKLAIEQERDRIAASLKNVLDSTTDGFAVLDKEGRYTYVNDHGAGIVLLRPDQMIGNCLWDLFPHASETEFGREYLRAVETGQTSHFTAFYPEPMNAWIECHCYPSEHGLSVYFRDITDQKKTEVALRASESRFRKLFESDLMGVGIPDRFGAFRESNDELLRMTGYTRADQEAGLVRWDTMTPPEYADLDAAHIKEAAERGSCTPYEKEYIRKDATRVPILCGYALLENSQDEYIGFVLDLSEQKQAERGLREREGRFRVLAESLPQMIRMSNAVGENIYCNQRFLDYSGLTDLEMMGFGWTNLVHPDDLQATLANWNHSVETGEAYLNEYRLRRKDGLYRYFLARAVPVRNEAGEIERWIGSSTDVHDQKLAEDALRKSEKLATAARLAASIAHEINNPLAAITNSLYLALLDESLRPDTKGHLQVAEQELRRVGHITTQTLQFHKQSRSPTRVDICDVAESVLALFGHRLANKNISLKAECERGAFATCFDGEVRQVIANLVSNALDAAPQDGVIRVRARRTRNWEQEHVRGVKIVVADNGHGIPPSVLEHIFEPFNSTKETTGIGLGLWVSDGIVRKHGGLIRVRSKAKGPKTGTVFSVFFPEASL